MQKVSLFIAATPWNLLNSLVFAAQSKNENCYLMYVDFPIGQTNPYLDALDEMQDASPFAESWCFHGKFKGAWKKWRSRVDELKQIRQIVAELKPDQVYVGSDRRIEFQCAMTEAVRHKPQVKGVYLDEGVFSYSCRLRSQTWRDRVLDSWVKRLMYPCDWKHPATIGGSDWVSEGWLLQPKAACNILQNKLSLHQILPDWYKHPKVLAFADALIGDIDTSYSESEFDLLLILPHPSQLKEEQKGRFSDLLKPFAEKTVAVKKHPRDDTDPTWTGLNNLVELPTHVPLEVLLPSIQFKEVFSAPSTAILSAICFDSDVKVSLLEKEPLFDAILAQFLNSKS